MSNDPKWLTRARWYNGVVETKGPQHNPKIMHLLDVADGKDDGKTLQVIRDDETPWCATFVSGVLEEVGVRSMRSAWARSYLKFGEKLSGPAVGAIVVASNCRAMIPGASSVSSACCEPFGISE